MVIVLAVKVAITTRRRFSPRQSFQERDEYVIRTGSQRVEEWLMGVFGTRVGDFTVVPRLSDTISSGAGIQCRASSLCNRRTKAVNKNIP